MWKEWDAHRGVRTRDADDPAAEAAAVRGHRDADAATRAAAVAQPDRAAQPQRRGALADHGTRVEGGRRDSERQLELLAAAQHVTVLLGDEVVPGAAVERLACAAVGVRHVRVGGKLVVARPATEPVRAGAAEELVVAVAPVEYVLAGAAVERVRVAVAAEDVVVRAAANPFDPRERVRRGRRPVGTGIGEVDGRPPARPGTTRCPRGRPRRARRGRVRRSRCPRLRRL